MALWLFPRAMTKMKMKLKTKVKTNPHHHQENVPAREQQPSQQTQSQRSKMETRLRKPVPPLSEVHALPFRSSDTRSPPGSTGPAFSPAAATLRSSWIDILWLNRHPAWEVIVVKRDHEDKKKLFHGTARIFISHIASDRPKLALMPFPAILIGIPFSAGFALLGRWLLLHPEKLPPRGSFTGPDSSMARIYKWQITIVGSFAVFFGSVGVVFYLLSWMETFSPLFMPVVILVAIVSGIYVSIHVRKEVRSRPKYVSDSPFGLWP